MKTKKCLFISCLLFGGILSLNSCGKVNDNVHNNQTDVIKAESLSVSVENITLMEDESSFFEVTITPQNVTDKKINLSYDEDIIKVEEVNDTTFKVTGLKEGKTEILISLDSNSSIKKSIPVTINKMSVDILPTEISTSFSRKVIGINEEIQLNVTFAPSNATLTKLRYISSDPSVITISNTGLIKGVAKGEAIITISSVDAPDIVPITLSLTCSDDPTMIANDKISSTLDSAIENESKDIVSGEINIRHKNRNSDVEDKFLNTYSSYQGAIYNNIIDYSKSSYLLYYGLMDNAVYEASKVDDKFIEEHKYNISEDSFFTGEVTEEEANEMTNLPAILPFDYSTSYTYGVGNFIKEYFIDGIFLNEANLMDTIIDASDNQITMSLTNVGYSNVEIYNLDLKFNDGNFASISYEMNEYLYEDYDSKNDSLLEGATPISYDDIDISLNAGEKTIEENPAIEPMDFYYQDFDVAFRKTSDEIGVDKTTFEVNDNITFDITSSSPETASSNFDRIEIVSVSNPEVISIGANKLTMFALKGGECEVTLASKYATKTFTLTVVVPELESLSFSSGLTDTLSSNDYVTFTVDLNPSGALNDIKVEIESGEEYATLGITGYGYYYLEGNKEMTEDEGIVILKAYSESRPEISVTKEIKVIKVKTPTNIRDILLSKTFEGDLSDFYDSRATLVFNNDNTGVFTVYNKFDEIFDKATFTWVISSSGHISIADVSYQEGNISSFSVSFSDPNYETLTASFVDELEYDEEYGLTIYCDMK